MPEPEVNANDAEARTSQPQEPWQDKVLADAIGYTKGLVSVLDSLTDGFQRRGRELDSQRARLAILQSERRTILQERTEFEARITALTAERDSLRTTLETHERELTDQRTRLASLDDERRTSLQERAEFEARITALTAERDSLRTTLQANGRDLDTLRQEAGQVQASLEARTREIQALRTSMAEPTRQAEELRDVVRSLERQLQRAGQLSARTPVTLGPKEVAAPSSDRSTPQLDTATFEAMFSDQPRTDDGRITALTAERDGLRTALEEHEQELDRLREDVARGQAALEAQTRDAQALRTGMAETERQAEEIRKVLQALEKEIDSAARREAVLEEALEMERRQVHETVVRAGQEQAALREDLTDAENVLAEARKDIGASQGLIASLQRTVDDEHARNAALRERLDAQTAELAHLQATVQAVPTLLNELVKAFGGAAASPKEDGAEAHEPTWLEALAGDTNVSHRDAEALAVLRSLTGALRDVLPSTAGVTAPRERTPDAEELRRRAEHIVDQCRRAGRQPAESAEAEEPAPNGPARAPEQGGPSGSENDVLSERVAPPPAQDRPAVPEAAPQEATERPSPIPASPVGAIPTIVTRPGSRSGTTVECTFPASGTETACILRGEIARINDIGVLGVFEERLPEGVQMVVRFVRGGEMVSCLGRVVRVQESMGALTGQTMLHHLIRFDSPVSASADNAQSSVN